MADQTHGNAAAAAQGAAQTHKMPHTAHEEAHGHKMPHTAHEEVLRLDGITKIYQMGLTQVKALDGINLSVKQGEWISVIGPSGSGKSTLLHILGLLDKPTAGSMHIDGIDVFKLNDVARSHIRGKKIGFIFQSFHLISSLDAIENVMLPMMFYGVPHDKRVERAKKALETLGMGDRMHHRPSELSGGQKQRVAIARSLVNDPSILLADEPTGNLDSKSGEDVMGIFDQLHKDGRTIIVVTHNANVASHSQKIVKIKDGLVEKIEKGKRGA